MYTSESISCGELVRRIFLIMDCPSVAEILEFTGMEPNPRDHSAEKLSFCSDDSPNARKTIPTIIYQLDPWHISFATTKLEKGENRVQLQETHRNPASSTRSI
jgi:hypothetical protein